VGQRDAAARQVYVGPSEGTLAVGGAASAWRKYGFITSRRSFLLLRLPRTTAYGLSGKRRGTGPGRCTSGGGFGAGLYVWCVASRSFKRHST
jgi:hypothetical protein